MYLHRYELLLVNCLAGTLNKQTVLLQVVLNEYLPQEMQITPTPVKTNKNRQLIITICLYLYYYWNKYICQKATPLKGIDCFTQILPLFELLRPVAKADIPSRNYLIMEKASLTEHFLVLEMVDVTS